jgi:hypothetical protein
MARTLCSLGLRFPITWPGGSWSGGEVAASTPTQALARLPHRHGVGKVAVPIRYRELGVKPPAEYGYRDAVWYRGKRFHLPVQARLLARALLRDRALHEIECYYDDE